MKEWIFVNKGLPACYIPVLVTDGQSIACAFRDVYGDWIPNETEAYEEGTYLTLNKITHWMVLPDLPK